jgi:hypothetical protein
MSNGERIVWNVMPSNNESDDIVKNSTLLSVASTAVANCRISPEDQSHET